MKKENTLNTQSNKNKYCKDCKHFRSFATCHNPKLGNSVIQGHILWNYSIVVRQPGLCGHTIPAWWEPKLTLWQRIKGVFK